MLNTPHRELAVLDCHTALAAMKSVGLPNGYLRGRSIGKRGSVSLIIGVLHSTMLRNLYCVFWES